MSEWVEVFRVGNYGKKGRFGVPDLDELITNFAAGAAAPLVIGHPKNDDPAYGWVSGLRRVGDVLQARFSDVHEAVRKAVAAKQYRNVSIRLARTAGGLVLKHVGLLGAVAPAVEGLAPVRFDAEADAVTIEFEFGRESEEVSVSDKASPGNTVSREEVERQLREQLEAEFSEKLRAKDLELAAERNALRRADAQSWAKEQVREGRLLPVEAEAVAEFCVALDGAHVDFSAEGAESASAFFRRFVERLDGRTPSLGEVAGRDSDPVGGEQPSSADFSAPDGSSVDTERLGLHQKALAESKRSNIPYREALGRVR